MPTTKNNNLRNLYLDIENSSTMTSEQAMYTKDPPAKQAHTSSIMSELVAFKAMPRRTPTGVKTANKQIIPITKFYSSGKVWAIEMPSDMPAAPLCMMMATAKMRTSDALPEMPRARPSKIAWVPNPINSTKGVILDTHDGFESSTV